MNSAWLKEWELYQELRRLAVEELAEPALPLTGSTLTVAVSRPERTLLSELWQAIDPPEGRAAGGTSLAVSATRASIRPVTVGQVLQLSPEVTDERIDPVFVLVTEVREGSAMLTAFSSLGVPAARDEFLTGIDEDGLRVLSPWNACWVPLVLARRSWQVAMDSAELMADYETYRTSLHAGLGVAERLRHRVGPPLDHPDDPRWSYYVQEGDKLIRLVELAMRMEHR